MSENLYNKYRPKTLNEVFGRTTLVKEYKKRFKENKISHNNYFEGLTGTGKTTIMRIIAKSILCKDKDVEGNACNVCEMCRTIDNERISHNYFEYNASNLNIEAVRDLEESASKRPIGEYSIKVYVIDEMQELNKNKVAEKNMLKLLEKQNDYTYFLLGTMDSSKVVSAIKDRGTYYKLKPFTFQDIALYLEYICKKENVIIDTKDKAETLVTIAQSSSGSMRKAVGFLERAINSELWTAKELLDELDIISNSSIACIINYIFAGDPKAVELEINKEVLDSLRYTLMLCYKRINGVNLNPYQKSQIKDININKYHLESLLNSLNDLFKYPYIYNDLIEFHILQVVSKIKSGMSMMEAKSSPEIKTRRVPRA
jgi:DNA polymerase III subunit gamma/tau